MDWHKKVGNVNIKELIKKLEQSQNSILQNHKPVFDGKTPIGHTLVFKNSLGEEAYLFTKARNFIATAYGKESNITKQAEKISDIEKFKKYNSLYYSQDILGALDFLIATLNDIDEENLISASQVAKIERKNPSSNKVFIVHGRNMTWLDEIETFINDLGYQAIVLYKDIQPGQTIIEKLESHADVFAAVVLLTPDDEGKLTGDEKTKTRARQNVVFEYGFFAGVIGRRSILIIDFGVDEKPSDIHGITLTNTSNENIEKAKAEISVGLTKIKNNISINKNNH